MTKEYSIDNVLENIYQFHPRSSNNTSVATDSPPTSTKLYITKHKTQLEIPTLDTLSRSQRTHISLHV